ncbi:MAG TPA: hypothetical protein VFW23_17535 [Tepidisphaeraceae bacterium]|nr:hypothetical protein [Tepidisphaeraceae bacterium]
MSRALFIFAAGSLSLTCMAAAPATQPAPMMNMPPSVGGPVLAVPGPQGSAAQSAPMVEIPPSARRPLAMPQGKGPATQPAKVASILPKEFAIFEQQNPFAHGPAAPPAPAGPPQGGPEASLVFKGVMNNSGKCIAFIEDLASKHVTQVMAGQPIGRGKIKSINLDAMEFEVMGVMRKILVGQNLDGQVVPPTPPQPPAQPPGGPPQGAQPVPNGPQPMPMPQPPPQGVRRIVSAPR